MRKRVTAVVFGAGLWLFTIPGGSSDNPAADEPLDGQTANRVPQPVERQDGWRVVETIFAQPSTAANEVDDRVIGEVRPEGERFYVRLANVGEMAASNLAGDIGQYTGFHPADSQSRALYQRGPRQAASGTAVQIRDTEIGIWIDSDHPRPRQGSLIPICPAYWWWDMGKAPRPFREPAQELSFSFDLQVPTAQRQGQAEVYLCAHFLFRDRQSGQQFWFGAILFDPRGADRFPDTVHLDNWEGGTGLPILFSALNDRSNWLHPGPGSTPFTDRTFTPYRRFDFRVGSPGLRAAIAAMKERWAQRNDASDDPRDYQLIHFNVNPEVYAPDGSRGQLGLAIRNITVCLLAPNR